MKEKTALLAFAITALVLMGLAIREIAIHGLPPSQPPFCECLSKDGRTWVPYRATACEPHPPECREHTHSDIHDGRFW